ncbi:MAG: chaperone NapD [Afipia felis]|nr:chaperone NapD [Afipia felis]
MKESGLSRRTFLSGQLQPPTIHISSAVVSVLPRYLDDVARQLSALPEVEIHHRSTSKLVIVLEGPDSGMLGARLAEISGWTGVLSANMVYEQFDEAVGHGEER